MRKEQIMRGLPRRALALLLALVMVAGYIPNRAHAAEPADPVKIADDSTWNRLDDIYGNDTLHAGKVTVDKSVSAGDANGNVSVEGQTITLKEDTNFLVTVSQAAQVMALTTEMKVPVDVVFVLDTSSSMTGGRSTSMKDAANAAISKLMAANEYNRIGVVAFSSAHQMGNRGAATQISPLGHYTGTAATSHLQITNGTLTSSATNAGSRPAVDGGTNIHAGVAMGAKMLTAASTTVEIDGETVTRMPFLIILSVICATMSYQMPTNCGIIRGGGSSGYVVKLDLISIWCIVVPLSLFMAFVVQAPPAIVVICLNLDQIFKCIPAFIKANYGHWAKKLTR